MQSAYSSLSIFNENRYYGYVVWNAANYYVILLQIWSMFWETDFIKWMTEKIHVKCAKGIKNGCPCIVEIRGKQGCALVGDPARAVGEYRDVAKAQP